MNHQIGFKYAWEGIKYSFTTQPNFRVHVLAAIAALFMGIWLKISATEWMVLVFSITLVFIAEMINTSIESMTDLIEEKHHQQAKTAKDVSAGMVLIASISSVIVGLVLFIPKLFRN